MGKLTPSNLLQFVSAESTFGQVNEDLSSFAEAGVLDEGRYYGWINTILSKLGIGYYSEEIAFLKVQNYRVEIPKNFKTFHAAYRCDFKHTENTTPRKAVFERVNYFTDAATQTETINNCCITADPCVSEKTQITVEHYVYEDVNRHMFTNFKPLYLGNSAVREICDFHGINHNMFNCDDSISFSNGRINTSYTDGYLYLFYYALPSDIKTGTPLIPNIESVRNAILYFIEYQILRTMWLNNSSPDLQNKMIFVKSEYDEALATAFVECCMPSYQAMRNKIKINKQNLVTLFQNQFTYGW